MAMTVRGRLGEVKWGYALAAAVHDWSVIQDAGVWTLTGRLVAPDAFRLSQQPLAFAARHADGVWRWSIETLQITGGTLTARLGPRGT